MTNHGSKSQGCTASGSTFKNFYFPQYLPCTQNDVKEILSKTPPVNGLQPLFSGP